MVLRDLDLRRVRILRLFLNSIHFNVQFYINSLQFFKQDEPSDDEDDDEEEVILRRHQQTGMDLNVTNLTTCLNLCPKPLTNSTPEKERTLRNINAALGREIQEAEDLPVSDSRAARPSRFSIMNEPPLL